VRKKIFMLVMFTFLGTTTLLAMGRRVEGALNPTLLWEKEFDGVVVDEGVNLARISGDAIVSLKKSGAEQIDRVLIFNTTGQLVQEWKNACYGRISDDGNKVIYLTPYSADSFYDKVHYATKDGQEIWWKHLGGDAYISPDGNLVVDASTAIDSTQLIEAYDATGKQIWSYKLEESIDVIFSPDSGYLAVGGNDGAGGSGTVRLYEKSGHLLWKAAQESISVISSMSEGASYISVLDGSRLLHSGVVYNKGGNVTFKGAADISEDGRKLIAYGRDSVSIYNLPEKAVLGKFPVGFIRFSEFNPMCRSAATSYGGEYVALFGKGTDTHSHSNFFVIGTETNEIWEAEIEPERESESGFMQVFLTRDGKYMLLQAKGKLYYYQLY